MIYSTASDGDSASWYGPLGSHRIVYVRDFYDTRVDRNVLSRPAERIALSVIPLMMSEYTFADIRVKIVISVLKIQ